ncbi:MAG: TlpA family protein disulfide reductase [Gammaproteobacteria bacterium]|nr:TlpA family protein disulfide reductase [Gammaproteobacteria bacterium]
MRVKKNIFWVFLALLSSVVFVNNVIADNFDLQLSKELEVNMQSYNADGKTMYLWMPSESGLLDQERDFAATLVKNNIEIWFADMLGAYFLPALASSIDKIDSRDTAKLIEQVRVKSKKNIILVGAGRGAALVLKAARTWQIQYGSKASLAGVILISPKLFIETPEPGIEGKLLPVIRKTNLPIVIIQPESSPWRWKMGEIVPALEKSGSDVYVWFLKNVRDRFYYRPDATQSEDNMAKQLPILLTNAYSLLKYYQNKTRVVSSKKFIEVKKVIEGKKERTLRAYKGNPVPPPLILNNMGGEKIDLGKMKGKVVLVNFWASWCPPCVHEMPSMQRLSNLFTGKSFEILAVNMAEDKKTIQKFLQEKVQVNFPILLDTDGQALKAWKVFAFPTSYVIGKKGKIRLALFGSVDWMQTDVVEKIKKLMNE